MEIGVIEGGDPVGGLQFDSAPEMRSGQGEITPLSGAQRQRVMIVIGVRTSLKCFFESALGAIEVTPVQQGYSQRIQLFRRLYFGDMLAHPALAHLLVHLRGMGQLRGRTLRGFGEERPRLGKVFSMKCGGRLFKYSGLIFGRIDGVG